MIAKSHNALERHSPKIPNPAMKEYTLPETTIGIPLTFEE